MNPGFFILAGLDGFIHNHLLSGTKIIFFTRIYIITGESYLDMPQNPISSENRGVAQK